ncbi:MBL fold metallo-hydrolase [Luteipulveratus sp. YIM 133132]|uniref:MBL fold metallo-hydrolase n=1 Tax=Luteipulveratus flavus TaxID=3031728 RepID=A0ABT6C7D5_9MICO|nr:MULTISPECIES: MBL fold metallo-hydrolase [unclassified Luteipulveratus]MDE9365744.1 MBL fold metallo-hydrolase [Luteipulveratus sp. YIM 133132]MDF8264817.1 MBL fold metallo-hydrolase [Luteipulveratus sp. YIM 133296]
MTTNSASEAWSGGRVGERALCVRCPNPGPMTLEGTNTWVLAEPGADRVVVVDPGPLDEDHLERVLEQVGTRTVALTVLTHSHDDHAGSAERWAELTGAAVRGAGRGEPFADDERITVAGLELRVILTPGHTRDSVSVVLPADRLLLTGDMVLGRGTSVVAHPDGDVASYLASLDRMIALTDEEVDAIAPGHGPFLPDARAVLQYYRDHRRARLEQVRAALDEGAAEADDQVEAVVEKVYADVDRAVWPAARLTVRAQLDYLARA